MVLKLYIDLMSQPCRAVTLFLRANSIPCEEVIKRIGKGEHLSDDYAKINPFKKLPALEHDGFKITESVAILHFLCRMFSVPDHWYPKNDVKKMACIDSYMAWQHLNLRSYGSMVFQTKLRSVITGEPVDERKMSRFQDGLSNVLHQIENIWLKDQKYISTDKISIADLLCATELEQPVMAGYDVRDGHPKISAYMDLIKSQLNPHYDNVHDMAYKVGKKWNAPKEQQAKL